jgi:hypothetical protein
MFTEDSKDLGRCFYCRNYNKIQRDRMIQWNVLFKDMDNMTIKTRFQRYEKKMVRDNLLYGRKNFIKSGFMGRDYKVNQKDRDKMDKASIMIAVKDSGYEKRIVWVKKNKGMLE